MLTSLPNEEHTPLCPKQQGSPARISLDLQSRCSSPPPSYTSIPPRHSRAKVRLSRPTPAHAQTRELHELEAQRASAPGSPAQATSVEPVASSIMSKLNDLLIVLLVLPIPICASAVYSFLTSALARFLFLRGTEPFASISATALIPPTFLGAIIITTAFCPLYVLYEPFRTVMLKWDLTDDTRRQWAIRIGAISAWVFLPFTVGVAVCPTWVPEGFAVVHALHLTLWGMFPIAVVMAVLGLPGCIFISHGDW